MATPLATSGGPHASPSIPPCPSQQNEVSCCSSCGEGSSSRRDPTQQEWEGRCQAAGFAWDETLSRPPSLPRTGSQPSEKATGLSWMPAPDLRVHAFFLPFWWPRYTPSGRPAPPAALSQLSQPPSPRPGGPAQVVPGRTHGTFRVCPHLLGVRASFSDGTEGPSWPRILSPTVRGGVHLPEPPANLGT